MVAGRVTVAAGVPTIWIGILLLDAEPKRWNLRPLRTMVIGGSQRRRRWIDGLPRAPQAWR